MMEFRSRRWAMVTMLAIVLASCLMPPAEGTEPGYVEPAEWLCEVDGVAGVLIYDGTCVTPAVYDVWYPTAGDDPAEAVLPPSQRRHLYMGRWYRSFVGVLDQVMM